LPDPELRLDNGMIHPIIGYGIRGVIWYQGEGNHKTPESYADLMKRMVAEWRNLWDIGDFPFFYVQIAPWQEYGVNSALLREAQLKALELIANSGIVINMDANSPYCVHPPNKKQVGERLACLALAKTYQMKGIPCNSPSLVSVDVKGQLMELTFDVPDNIGLTSDVNEIKGFKIAGNDRVFYHATATIYKNKVIILAPEVSEPVAIRYAFDNASPSEIFSLDGLPVSSFRTDNW